MAEDADDAQQALHLRLEAARETGGAGGGEETGYGVSIPCSIPDTESRQYGEYTGTQRLDGIDIKESEECMERSV